MKSQNCHIATFKIKSLHSELIIARGQLNLVTGEREEYRRELV